MLRCSVKRLIFVMNYVEPLCCMEIIVALSMIFSKTSRYRGPFVPIIHPADGLFTAFTNVAGKIVSDSFR
jgi:hypothetical protein